MTKFTESQLEQAILQLLKQQGYPLVAGDSLKRAPDEVLITADLRAFLRQKYAKDKITDVEINRIIHQIEALPSADLYASNKMLMKWLADGFQLKREDRSLKDLYIYLLDYNATENNHYKMVNQLLIEGSEQRRIPDGVLYINGLPLVVFEFKSAIRKTATLEQAHEQITRRYRKDIPALFKTNAFCVLSDGVNTKAGSFFAEYGFYYAWRKVTGDETVARDGVNALHTMMAGLFDKKRLLDVMRNFIYLPDTGNEEVKILCRYPQYYAARKLFANIQAHQKPLGDGKGGTYFGATGCGKSYTMLFLSRLLMKSVVFASPTLVLITDRTDLDVQLSTTFSKAKHYLGDDMVQSVTSRENLRALLQGRESGGVFLTTIHKFTEDIALLTERSNVICISDEAHRSQTNLDVKIRLDDSKGVTQSYGFAKYLHDSLPNATYVGFTGTPVDATLNVFGAVVDAYTMTESVKDNITVPIVYEGRAAKVVLDNQKLEAIEDYYAACVREGTSEYHIDESKKSSINMLSILGDPERLKALAGDFVQHYETRLQEGSSVKGKAMFVISSRQIAYDFYKELIALRPEWAEEQAVDAADKVLPMARVKLIMTRNKDKDSDALYQQLGTKEYRKSLDEQFKQAASPFKIAIVVDMWLTGFDVPFLDTIYIDKPLQKHNLIQTISRVNRNFKGKQKGLVVDYIGIKQPMNQALAMYSKIDSDHIEDIQASLIIVRDHLDLLARILHGFDSSDYFTGEPLARLNNLKNAAEFVQTDYKIEQRFMALVKRLKAAYDICSGSDELGADEREQLHFYLAIRTYLFKLVNGNAPDTAQMNARVREMVKQALHSDGVEEVFKMGEEAASQVDLFDDAYLARLTAIELPHTKIKLLQQLLSKAISDLKKVNKVQGIDFSKKFQALVERYNERDAEHNRHEVAEDLIDFIHTIRTAMDAGDDLGISFEEKAFYDILKLLATKYSFEYAENKLIELSKAVKALVDSKAKYVDWNTREDIKAELKFNLMMLLDEHGYPPIDKDEIFQEVFQQAENYKQYHNLRN